jgi:uncharacterized protein (TIGR03086 family)
MTQSAAPRRPDDIALLLQAISYALAVADGITPDLLSRPTPCQGWDLGMLLRHANESLAALLEAVDSGSVGAFPSAEDPAADLPATFRDRARRLADACTPAGRRHRGDRVIVIADRALALNAVACLGALEIALHGWDIARACGTRQPIPRALAADLLAIAPLLVAEDGRHPLFASPVTPAPADSPSDRLAAFLGRDPRA